VSSDCESDSEDEGLGMCEPCHRARITKASQITETELKAFNHTDMGRVPIAGQIMAALHAVQEGKRTVRLVSAACVEFTARDVLLLVDALCTPEMAMSVRMVDLGACTGLRGSEKILCRLREECPGLRCVALNRGCDVDVNEFRRIDPDGAFFLFHDMPSDAACAAYLSRELYLHASAAVLYGETPRELVEAAERKCKFV
tara:strand:- start:3005 stop:3604 length:600 start_codon:yes stop_codon:yes gene_type:complete